METEPQGQLTEDDNPHVVVGYDDALLFRFLVLKLVHYGITFMVRPGSATAEEVTPDKDAVSSWDLIVRKNDLSRIREIIEVSYFKG